MNSNTFLTRTAGNEPQEPCLEHEIRIRAYYIYLERGKREGRELDDWLEAEREELNAIAKGTFA